MSLLLIGGSHVQALPADEPKPETATVKPEPTAERPKPKITISKETTYITGPLRKDGYVDYVAALNQRYSQGVTPDNNAAVPFWRAVGPKELDAKIRKRYFEMLGMANLPDEGEYLVRLEDVVAPFRDRAKPGELVKNRERIEDAEKQYAESQKTPWRENDCPAIASLLKWNEKPLQKLCEAFQRKQLYSPLVSSSANSSMDIALGPTFMPACEVARQLHARAMLRIGEGDLAGAWQDVLAQFRASRLYGQGPFFIDRVTASAREATACNDAVALVTHDGVSKDQVRQWQADLRSLPAVPPIRAVLDEGERFFQINSLIEKLAGPETEPNAQEKLAREILDSAGPNGKRGEWAWDRLTTRNEIDWDEVLRLWNTRYDRVVAAFSMSAWSDRARLLKTLGEEAESQAKQTIDGILSKPSGLAFARGMTPKQRAECAVYVILRPGLFDDVYTGIARSEQTASVRRNMTDIAFALAAYKADHAAYPKMLPELRPDYISNVPRDGFRDAEFVYKQEDAGYLLYSVGPNGKDDGGRSFYEEHYTLSEEESASEAEKARDDIAIRTPVKTSGKK